MDTALVLSACVAAPEPPFDLTNPQPTKVLDVVQWLGSLNDLSQVKTVIDGLDLGSESTGHIGFSSATDASYQIYNTSYLDLRDRSKKIDLRAEVKVLLDRSKTCLRYEDFQRRFSKPVSSILIPDLFWTSYSWLIGSTGRWHTYVSAEFDENDKHFCLHELYIWQNTGSRGWKYE